MVYSIEQNTVIIKSYYRNGVLNEDGQLIHSVQTCKNAYHVAFPGIDIEEESLMAHIRRVVDRFDDT